MKKLLIIAIAILTMTALTACLGSQKEEVFEGSMKDLFERGENLKCVYEIQQDGTTISGTTYIAGEKKMRGDFKTIVEGQEIDSHMINNGEWMYTWSNMQNTGMKMNIDEMEEEFADEENSQDVMDDWNEDYQYKCSKWSVDNSMFNPPSEIDFIDWTQMMNGFMDLEAMTTDDDKAVDDQYFDMQSLCKTCDYLTGNEKQECLTNLGC